jgi:GTP cyclohydrolase I
MTRTHPTLHIAREAPGVDLDAAEQAAGDFLKALGVDVDSDDLRETPSRMASGWCSRPSTPA